MTRLTIQCSFDPVDSVHVYEMYNLVVLNNVASSPIPLPKSFRERKFYRHQLYASVKLVDCHADVALMQCGMQLSRAVQTTLYMEYCIFSTCNSQRKARISGPAADH
jgi:hypothetical protein